MIMSDTDPVVLQHIGELNHKNAELRAENERLRKLDDAACAEIGRLGAERDALRAAADAAYWWNAAAHTVRETARANGAEWVAEQIEQHRERIAAALGDYKPEHVA